MSVKYLKSLLFKSAQIQEEIEKEHRRVQPDGFRLLRLKKLRLAIKDKILQTMQALRQRSQGKPMGRYIAANEA